MPQDKHGGTNPALTKSPSATSPQGAGALSREAFNKLLTGTPWPADLRDDPTSSPPKK
jgi:hypothetical protein